jgi:hypothetical protein
MDEMDPKKPKRKSCSYRISPEVDAELRDFVRRQRGEPLFCELGSFVEEAIRQYLAVMRQRLEEDRAGHRGSIATSMRANHSASQRSLLPMGIDRMQND